MLLHKKLTDEILSAFYEVYKASSIELGFVLNFGKTPEFSRIVFSNHKKHLKK